MTTFLLLFSLFLNFLALFAIIVLFLRQNRLMQVEKKQEKVITEMEEVISSYLVQMKEENEEFISRVKKMDIRSRPSISVPNADTEKDLQNRRPEKLDKADKASPQENNFQSKMGKVSVFIAANAYKQNGKAASFDSKTIDESPLNKELVELPPLEIDEVNDNNTIPPERESESSESKNGFQEQSFLSQVLLLKKEGLSEEKIAQKLNKGKTEIELLLKFNQNQQE